MGGDHVSVAQGVSPLVSETIDLRLLGKMVMRLQSTVEDVRQEYAGIRASLDSLTTTVMSRNAEFNVRMSGLELAQMKLAASVDNAHTKLDRLELDVHALRERIDLIEARQERVEARLEQMETRLEGLEARVKARLDGLDGKLDLILARIGGA